MAGPTRQDTSANDGTGRSGGLCICWNKSVAGGGRVEARGKLGKKRKIEVEREGNGGVKEESVHDETAGADGNGEAMVEDVLPSLSPSTT